MEHGSSSIGLLLFAGNPWGEGECGVTGRDGGNGDGRKEPANNSWKCGIVLNDLQRSERSGATSPARGGPERASDPK